MYGCSCEKEKEIKLIFITCFLKTIKGSAFTEPLSFEVKMKLGLYIMLSKL